MLSERLRELGLQLPEPAAPVASYVPARRHGDLVYVSGQLPLRDGKLLMTDTMDHRRDLEECKRAMQQCLLNGIAAALALKLEVSGVLQLGAYVASTSEFTDQHLVANGASDLALSIFGEAGRHTRFAVGVSSLPLNATVELAIVFTVKAA